LPNIYILDGLIITKSSAPKFKRLRQKTKVMAFSPFYGQIHSIHRIQLFRPTLRFIAVLQMDEGKKVKVLSSFYYWVFSKEYSFSFSSVLFRNNTEHSLQHNLRRRFGISNQCLTCFVVLFKSLHSSKTPTSESGMLTASNMATQNEERIEIYIMYFYEREKCTKNYGKVKDETTSMPMWICENVDVRWLQKPFNGFFFVPSFIRSCFSFLCSKPKWKWDELYVGRRKHPASEARFHVNISFVDVFGFVNGVWLQFRFDELMLVSILESAAR
jgi:hypothetical protein